MRLVRLTLRDFRNFERVDVDVLNHIDSDTVTVTMGDSNSSALVQMPGRDDFKYVVMPMRI